MADRLHQISSRLRYLVQAQTKIRLHSPFVFAFYRDVLDDRRQFYAFPKIQTEHKSLLQSAERIQTTDFGTGESGKTRSVSSIARHAAASPRLGRLLFRIVEYFGPEYILELGTSVGIGTRYLAAPKRHKQLITLEGDPAVAAIARKGLADYPNVELIEGPFNNTLEGALQKIPRLDFLWLDGDHSYEATVRNFESCLQKAHEDSCLAIDDIYWSRDMTRAWEAIKQHPSVRLSIDLNRFGMVFLRTANREKEHFTLRW